VFPNSVAFLVRHAQESRTYAFSRSILLVSLLLTNGTFSTEWVVLNKKSLRETSAPSASVHLGDLHV
jgi:hypothetical protein